MNPKKRIDGLLLGDMNRARSKILNGIKTLTGNIQQGEARVQSMQQDVNDDVARLAELEADLAELDTRIAALKGP